MTRARIVYEEEGEESVDIDAMIEGERQAERMEAALQRLQSLAAKGKAGEHGEKFQKMRVVREGD